MFDFVSKVAGGEKKPASLKAVGQAGRTRPPTASRRRVAGQCPAFEQGLAAEGLEALPQHLATLAEGCVRAPFPDWRQSRDRVLVRGQVNHRRGHFRWRREGLQRYIERHAGVSCAIRKARRGVRSDRPLRSRRCARRLPSGTSASDDCQKGRPLLRQQPIHQQPRADIVGRLAMIFTGPSGASASKSVFNASPSMTSSLPGIVVSNLGEGR